MLGWVAGNLLLDHGDEHITVLLHDEHHVALHGGRLTAIGRRAAAGAGGHQWAHSLKLRLRLSSSSGQQLQQLAALARPHFCGDALVQLHQRVCTPLQQACSF